MPLRIAGIAALALALLVFKAALSRDAAPARQTRGFPHGVVFTKYTPLFSNSEIVRRLLSPLAREAVRNVLLRRHEALSPYSLDLSKERFLVYVPSEAPPPQGFGLLVFVPPWERARVPFGWAMQLDRYGIIFVSPERAGNAEAVLSRRVPLALSAEENIVRQYPIDPERIYIGGFSGGSRVALRIALAYPDIFHGALLEAGADPLDVADPWGGPDALPARDLFRRFQSSSRLVYVSGELDTVNLTSDADSAQSMRHWCVFDVETHQIPDAGHELMSGAEFGRALDRLMNAVPPDPALLSACRSRIGAELEAKLSQAAALVSSGRHAAARRLLLKIDRRYAGLAAPRIIKLAQACGCGLAQLPSSSVRRR